MKLTAIYSPFTTFCEGPENIEKGYDLFYRFHYYNFRKRLPKFKNSKILVVSSGVGYFQFLLKRLGYSNVLGIDSDRDKVEYAKKKGLNSRCENCFEHLEQKKDCYKFIFAEQEVNHLTKDEFIYFINLCYNALQTSGKLIVSAANCANPLIAPEHTGNNIDHYTSFAENSMKQYFTFTSFKKIEVFSQNFYVLWTNPLNYVAKLITSSLHFVFYILFRIYGKSNKIFSKRFSAIATK